MCFLHMCILHILHIQEKHENKKLTIYLRQSWIVTLPKVTLSEGETARLQRCVLKRSHLWWIFAYNKGLVTNGGRWVKDTWDSICEFCNFLWAFNSFKRKKKRKKNSKKVGYLGQSYHKNIVENTEIKMYHTSFSKK